MGLNLRKYGGSILAIVLVQLILVSAVWAGPRKVYYAGFAFLSDYSDVSHEYPYSKIISSISSESEDRPKIEAVLKNKVEEISNPNIEIIFGGGGKHDSANALSLALAIDWEDVCVEKVSANSYKIVLNIHAQILVFDFNEKKIIASYPFGVRVNDSSKTYPSEKHIQKLFRQLYFQKIGKVNFLDVFIERLQKIKIQESDDHLLKVTEVVLGEKSFELMPEKIKNHPDAYRKFVAQQFSSFLAANQGVSVLPYTEGHAIKGKMALQFEDTTVLNLTIPPADIPITITVRGFKKVMLDQNHTGSQWAYCSFIKFKVDPFRDSDPVIDTRFKYAADKFIPASQANVTIDSDWSAYEETLLLLFNELTQQISKRSSTWISSKTKDKKAKSQLKELDRLLKGV